MPSRFINLIVLFVVSATFVGCASSVMKARKDQREKASQSSKLYCDFVNGELYPDVEVMLNLEMAKRCDSQKSYSISNYKTSNENMGVLYCCTLVDNQPKESKEVIEPKKIEPKATPVPAPAAAVAPTEAKVEAKTEVKAETKTVPTKKASITDDGLGD